MIPIKISKIIKNSIEYNISGKEMILEKGFATLGFKVDFSESKDNKKNKKASIHTTFKIFSEKPDNLDVMEEETGEAYIFLNHNMFYEQLTDAQSLTDKDILYYMEPYIRKEITDFLYEMGLSSDLLPYRFWDENEK